MAQITFSKNPLKKYYSYLRDGHIYKITNQKPTTIADEGSWWCCYFECEPYHLSDDGKKTFLLYETVVDEEGTVKYIPAKYGSFNKGNVYSYTEDGKEFVEHSGEYYSKNGKFVYDMPDSASDLPQVTYDGQTYYFDKLINCGDSYKSNKFVPMDVDGQSSTSTTYGSLLMDMVKNNISINAFTSGVKSIPEYLTGPDLTVEYKIEDIEYTMSANYFVVYGKLFIEKLNEEMVELGTSLSEKYKSDDLEPYNALTIESDVSDSPVGTITVTPSLK